MLDFSAFIADLHSIVLAVVLLAATIYLCIYYGLYPFRVGRWHLKQPPIAINDEDLPAISVMLTAHNDAAWLKENLVYLLEQNYPRYEVVVVNYLSQDDTEFVLKLLHDYYPHLKVRSFQQDVNLFQGKKYPLSIGIKSAANDILVFADPECTPKNLNWLRGIVRGYMAENGHPRKETQLVLGYCGLKRTRTPLGWLQQYDTLSYGAQYLGSALLGHPYTGSGRNLSYRRTFFFDNGGFIRHYDISDGSDDLFVYQNATRQNTTICIDSDACLTTEPKHTFAEWHAQRRHRVATRARHSLGSRLRESMPQWTCMLFYLSAAGLFVLGHLPWVVLVALIVLKWAWQIVCFSRLTKRFEGGHIHWAAPLMEIYFALANTILIFLPLPTQKKYPR